MFIVIYISNGEKISGQMELIDVGGLPPDDNRTIPRTSVQNSRRRGGAIKQDKPNQLTPHGYSVQDTCNLRLLIFLRNCNQTSLPMAIFVFSAPKCIKREYISSPKQKNKSKFAVRCNQTRGLFSVLRIVERHVREGRGLRR